MTLFEEEDARARFATFDQRLACRRVALRRGRRPPSPRRSPARARLVPSASAPASGRPAGAACPCPCPFSVLSFARVQRLLHQLEDPFLARRLVVFGVLCSRLAFCERERKMPAGDLVKSFLEERCILRLFGK